MSDAHASRETFATLVVAGDATSAVPNAENQLVGEQRPHGRQ